MIRRTMIMTCIAIPDRFVEDDSSPAFFGIVCGVSGWGIRRGVWVSGRAVSMIGLGRVIRRTMIMIYIRSFLVLLQFRIDLPRMIPVPHFLVSFVV